MSKKNKDPFAEREAAKYDRPIPSREFILNCLEELGRPIGKEVLAQQLKLDDDEEQREALRRRLRAMERDGQIMRNRQGEYGLVSKMQLLKGRVMGHRDGFGFLRPEEGGEDYYIHAREMRFVMDGDTVLARVSNSTLNGRREVEVVEILTHTHRTLVGRYYQEKGMGFIKPHNTRIAQDVLIPPGQEEGAKPNQWVVAEITAYPSRRYPTLAKIIEILGDEIEPGMEIELALRAHELPHVFSPEALADAAQYTDWRIPEKEYKARRDVRSLPFVTIDGEDAKDFDDAVYCEAAGRGTYRLYVAIADVSYYVTPGSALDQEAERRATSVYFPRQVIPMLPEILSNEWCSLKPAVDRLCVVCEMHINASGQCLEYTFYRAIMHSHARLTYGQAQAIFDGAPAPREDLAEPLLQLNKVYQVLHRARQKRGAIDFDTVETQFVFDEHKKIAGIVPRHRLMSHRVIEECMLAANVCAAEYVLSSDLPVLYRVHAGPDPAKLMALRAFLLELGIRLGGGDDPKPKDFSALIRQIQDRPEKMLLQTLTLRSLLQANYSPQNVGHFGLAYDAYAHFTSPIRRYPDLLIHRAIVHHVERRRVESFPYTALSIQQLGEHCSFAERRADQASWDVIASLKCQFMQDKVGQSFGGLVTSVTSFGLFVELDQVYVEGLVHISVLESDYYRYDAARHCLIGERTNKCYSIGERVEVKLTRVNLEERKIDLVLIGQGSASGSPKKKKVFAASVPSVSKSQKNVPKPNPGHSKKKPLERKKEKMEGETKKPRRRRRSSASRRKG